MSGNVGGTEPEILEDNFYGLGTIPF